MRTSVVLCKELAVTANRLHEVTCTHGRVLSQNGALVLPIERRPRLTPRRQRRLGLDRFPRTYCGIRNPARLCKESA
jgi:hypothetical protein